jgi:hypothetical protein
LNTEITLAEPSVASSAIMMSPGHLQALMNFAEVMAKSALTVPQHLQGKPADCMAIAMQAAQWGMNPFAVAQKTHIVSGRLGYEAQLVNAVVQASGAIRGSFHYEYRGAGDALECRVGAVLRGEGEVTWGEWLRNGDVTTRNSPLWKVNPKQQLGYLQVKNWARLHTPGAILGVYTPDELETVAPPAVVLHMGDAEEVKPAGPRRRSESATEAPAETAQRVDSPPPPAAAAVQPVQTQAGGITGNQAAYLRKKLQSASLAEETICDRFQVTAIELMSADHFDVIKAELLGMG